ncbi:hypothetical protein KNE206_58290 [Kitasatospora sp. NE20-6]|uniref:DUF4240 domain-containing protein n=1 Tax=Kitasatospora sp. NE20-6 TaxID=2859066 RepID=UPI0034DC27D1
MGFEGQVWRLVRREEEVGEIVIEEADFPWLRGRFVPGPGFAVVRPLFVRALALSEAEDWEAFDGAYQEIADTMSMVAPSGPVAEFLLHVQDDQAWFRWSDEPFEDEPFEGGRGEDGPFEGGRGEDGPFEGGRGDRAADRPDPSAGAAADLDPPVMTWERFWQLIEVLGGEDAVRTCERFEKACARLTEVLAGGSAGSIIGFGERLAEALHRLDRQDFGTLPVLGTEECGGSPLPQSDDGFLYARAAVVAAGRRTYEGVFGHPERFAPFTAHGCELLLHVHEEAFEQVTGTAWDRLTRYDYESCSNEDGWPALRG